jgi:hypothetical protein
MVPSIVNGVKSRFRVLKGAKGFWEIIDKRIDNRLVSVCETRNQARIKVVILEDFHSGNLHPTDFIKEYVAAHFLMQA